MQENKRSTATTSIGVRVNPHGHYGKDRIPSGPFPISTYFYFAENEKKLLRRMYKYFGLKELRVKVTDDQKALFEPNLTNHDMIAHEMYFSDSKALETCFKSILQGYSLHDAFTKENIILNDLIKRAREIEKKVPLIKKPSGNDYSPS